MRYMNSIDENMEIDDKTTESKDASIDDDNDNDNDNQTVWMQTYKIKGEYQVNLSRENILQFQIENGKGSIMVNATCITTRERDILAIVIQALADAKMKRKQRKKRSQDLVLLHIDVLGDNKNGKHNKTIEQQNQIRQLQTKLSQIHQKMVDLQKVR